MERRPRTPRNAAPRRVAPTPTDASELAHIAALIDGGDQITIGSMHPIKCAAIANDSHNSLAMLQRRPQESLQQLLERLDAAISLAWNKNEFTDEINIAIVTGQRR